MNRREKKKHPKLWHIHKLSMASGRVARRVERLAECPCELLAAHHADEVVFDDVPARGVAELGDRNLIINIAHVVQSLHVGAEGPLGWMVEFDDDDGILLVMVKFPKKTVFTARQLALVELVNEIRIKEVWVQPEDDCVYVGVAVWRSDVAQQLTVDDLVILRRRVDGPDEQPVRTGARKRVRVGAAKKP